MRTELQLDARSSASEREVGAYSFIVLLIKILYLRGWGVLFRGQIEARYNLNFSILSLN